MMIMRTVILFVSGLLFVSGCFIASADPQGKENAGRKSFRTRLSSFEEVPAVSTTGAGEFRAQLSREENSLAFELEYSGLEGGAVQAAHVHLGQAGVNGGIMFFLCGGGTQVACPASGKITGVVSESSILGPAEQGIAPGQFAEALRAMRSGVAYVNVHTQQFPGGEIRGQIGRTGRPLTPPGQAGGKGGKNKDEDDAP
jgi:hypothetical protein